ncbi:hypothetical protein FQA39_LY16309 [Lamprigera yunnana]|nr:hypothetical protein FQA39_LY16309 [Lamprigera yunnana]
MLLILTMLGTCLALPTPGSNISDGQDAQRILGFRVPVSVITEAGNNSKPYFSDAVGKPVSKPATPIHLASPINLLNPDRYEFYTFDDTGDLIKRLMTLDEIQGIIASGDGEPANYYSQSLNGDIPEQRVEEVINNVQNVLKEEIQAHKPLLSKPEITGPDVSSTWNLILPSIFGASPNVVPYDGNDTVLPVTLETPNSTVLHTTDATKKTQTKPTVPNFVVYEENKSTTENVALQTQTNINENPKTTILELSITSESPTTFKTNDINQNVQYVTTELPPISVTSQHNIQYEEEGERITTNEVSLTTETSTIAESDVVTTYGTEQSNDDSPTTIKNGDTSTSRLLEDGELIASSFANIEVPTSTEYRSNLDSTQKSAEQNELSYIDVSNSNSEASTLPETTTQFKYEELTTEDNFEEKAETRFTTEAADTKSTLLPEYTTATDKSFVNVQSTESDYKLIRNSSPTVIEELPTSSPTTEFVEQQNIMEIDKNVNEAVDSLISQIVNQDFGQTTIENFPSGPTVMSDTTLSTTESLDFTTTLVDNDSTVTNKYEELNLEYLQPTSTLSYESKTIKQQYADQTTTDKELPTDAAENPETEAAIIKNSTTEIAAIEVLEVTTEVPKSENIAELESTTQYILTSSVPNKNLKTDSSNYDFKAITTEEPTTTETYTSVMYNELTTTVESTSNNYKEEVYSITELFPQEDKNYQTTVTSEVDTTSPPLEDKSSSISSTTTHNLSTEYLSTTPMQEFVSIETITSSSKIEKQPELHLLNKVSSTTSKQDTTWTLVSTLAPHKTTLSGEIEKISNTATAVDLVPKPLQGFGLEDSTSSLEADVFQFTELCNELAFSFWNSVTSGISFARSVVVSPFATTSILAMVFLGARGSTSGEMNDILKLDDMVTFNPHAIFKNVIESIEVSKKSGVATSVFVKELYSDKNKGKLLSFYKDRVKQFYDGYVEEVNFKEINDVIRRRTNLLVKRQTWGKISDYLKDNNLSVRPPLAAVTANIFQTDCSGASTAGRDGELHFVVLPSIRQRKLVPVPAVVWRSGFLAGYEPGLDATAVSIGNKAQTVSTIFVIPGQQGISAPGDGLVRLETRLMESAFKQNGWSRLLRSLIPRPGLEVQIPRFSHKSIINATAALQRMGLKDVFNSKTADLKGLNGIAHELFLSDIIQVNSFATCGEGRIDETHHSEIYPATTNRAFRRVRKIQNYHHQISSVGDLSDEPRDYQRAFHDPLYDPTHLSLPLQFRPRQARLPEIPRLRLDRPFLYFVRHNPTGLILHMGRFNPRLLP